MSLNSSTSIQRELDRLNTKFDGLVPNEAKVQEYESSIDIASKEYIEALQLYNEKRMGANFPIRLQVIERAMPGLKMPSKKKILILVAGIACFSLCLLVFFVVYFFDMSIREPDQLANSTNMQVLGHLNIVNGGLDKDKIYDHSPSEESLRLYHSLIRSLRYELLNEGNEGAKVITVSSLCKREGKTSVVLGLAWAFARISKRVLIIDGNFGQPELSTLGHGEKFAEFDETHFWPEELDSETWGISILGNDGGDVSVLEIVDEKELKKKFQYLRSYYDIILVEADPLSSLNKAKEWTSFSDHLLMVFESGKTIKSSQMGTIKYLESLGSTFSGWVLNKRTSLS
jgi:Mrp family chromosome partitioning ATPase